MNKKMVEIQNMELMEQDCQSYSLDNNSLNIICKENELIDNIVDDKEMTTVTENNNCCWDGPYCQYINCDGFKCKRIVLKDGKKATKDMYNIQTMCESNKQHCGKYMFPMNETFYKLYQKRTLKNLLETRGQYSKFVMDFDINYPTLENINKNGKFYTDDMVYNIIIITRTYLQEYIPILDYDKLDCCVLEKDIYQKTLPNGNIIYKGGFHLQFLDFTLENKSLSKSGFLNDLKQAIETNVGLELDVGAYNNAWFLYGSSKDIHLKPYVLTKIVGRLDNNVVVLEDINEYFGLDDNQLDLLLPKLLSINSFGDDTIESFTLKKLKKDDDVSSVSSAVEKKELKKEYDHSQFSKEIFEKLISCYSLARRVDYFPWLLMCFALKNTCNGSELGLECFKLFSDNGVNYNESSCELQYDKAEIREKDGESALSVASLYYWAKEDNETLFYKLFPLYKDSYFMMKKEFEITHFKNTTNGYYYEINEKNGKVININSRSSFDDRYCHLHYAIYDEEGVCQNKKLSFIYSWTRDPKIRMYKNVDVILPPNICPDNTYNLFRGFDCERTIVTDDEKIELKPLLDKVISHFDLIFDKQEYCWNYIASMIQNPGLRPDIAIMIKSVPGVGKEIMFNFLAKIITKEYTLSTVDVTRDVFGQFNPLCRNILLYLWDEMEYKVSSSLKEKMKWFLTSKTITINDKNKTPYIINSVPFVFLFSNNQFPLPIDEKDRRFFALDISHLEPQKTEYFAELIDIMENEKVIRMFYDHIMNIDISTFNIRKFPITEFVKEIKSLSRPRELDFMIYFLQQKRTGITNMDLYKEFELWLSENYSDHKEYKTNTKSFGIKLKNFKIDGMIKNDKKYGVYWSFDIEKTMSWLLSKEYIDKEFKDDDEK